MNFHYYPRRFQLEMTFWSTELIDRYRCHSSQSCVTVHKGVYDARLFRLLFPHLCFLPIQTA